MNDQNMFRDCGEEGFYANIYGARKDIILVNSKDSDVIYCKDDIPLGTKVHLMDETLLGTVEKSLQVEKSVGNVHEITLYKETVKVPVTIIETDLSVGRMPTSCV